MKILHIASISKSQTSGVSVVVPQYVKNQSQFADIKFLNLNNIDVGLEKFQMNFDEKNLSQYLSETFDLVVFNEVNNFHYIKLYKFFKKNNIPYIIIPHGEITNFALRKKWLKKKIAYILFFNSFIRNAKAIQCLSENERKNIKIKTPNKFIGTNGIYDSQIKKEQFSNDGMKLLYIGRLDKYHKGLDLLLSAIGKIQIFCRENDVSLEIYGPNILKRKETLLKIIEKNKINDIVKIYDPIFGKDKENAILKSDVYIQTSRFEGMPVGILEVLNYGMPAILTKGTNLTKDNEQYQYGYVCENNISSIASAIERAFAEKQKWNGMSKNAIKFVNENYLWEATAKNTILNYKEIL